jgi:hypothetical protein
VDLVTGFAPPKAIPSIESVPRVLTRTGVARLLCVTTTRVKALEKSGKLHPMVDKKTGVHHFERAEVLQLVRARGQRLRSELVHGPKAARAFAMFEARCALSRIVIELELTPESVRQLYAEWLALAGPEPHPVELPPEAPAPPTAAQQAEASAREAEELADLDKRTRARRAAVHANLFGTSRR